MAERAERAAAEAGRVIPAQMQDWRPTATERSRAQGAALLRIARELTEFLSDAPEGEDEDAESLKKDVAVIEEVGRWLSSCTVIEGGGLRA